MNFETFKAGRWHARRQHKSVEPASPTQRHVVLAIPGLFLSHLNPEVGRFSL
jgi:hypothetical protein